MSDLYPPRVIRIAAAVISDADGRLLLVRKRGTRAFMQPGGKIEPGEAPEEALARELEEELGLDVAAGAMRALGRRSAPAANEPGYFVEAELFALSWQGDLWPGAEIEELLWLDVKRPGDVEIAPLTRDHVFALHREALAHG